ncbi:unnamed protein product, partial [Pleuronectes platessa]
MAPPPLRAEADSRGVFGLEPCRAEGAAEHDTCVEELRRLRPPGSQERQRERGRKVLVSLLLLLHTLPPSLLLS